MKKSLLRFTCLALLSVTLFVSCNNKGDDTDPPAPKTKTQLIAQGNWRFSSATWGGSDAGSLLQACWKDNFMHFTVSGTGVGDGTIDEGLTKCNMADPQTTNFSWSFQSSESVLVMSAPVIPGGSGNFTIVSLTADQLILSQPVTISGVTQTAIVTFVH